MYMAFVVIVQLPSHVLLFVTPWTAFTKKIFMYMCIYMCIQICMYPI